MTPEERLDEVARILAAGLVRLRHQESRSDRRRLVHRRIQRIHSGVRSWPTGAMAQKVCPLVSAEDRARLEAIIADRNRAQKHVARARIILGSAARLPVAEVARRAGISLRSVQRIWAAHDLQPHRIRTFKRSRDPAFAAKLADIVGLYVDPPEHALVLSVDEKSHVWMAPGSQEKS